MPFKEHDGKTFNPIYTDRKRHAIHFVRDRGTDDSIMIIADHTIYVTVRSAKKRKYANPEQVWWAL